MEARELRIGNWAYDYGIYIKIEAEDIYCFFDLNYNPIPLTEEILLKCGFEKLVHSYSAGNTFVFEPVMVCLSTKIEIYIFGEGRSEIKTHAKYLHQLQNLYFALTGEELEVKL